METLPLPCHPACPSLPRNRSEAKRRDLRYYRTHRGKEAKPTCPDISPARKGWEIGGYGPGTWLTLQLVPQAFPACERCQYARSSRRANVGISRIWRSLAQNLRPKSVNHVPGLYPLGNPTRFSTRKARIFGVVPKPISDTLRT